MTAATATLRRQAQRWRLRLSRCQTTPATLAYRSIYVLPTRNGLMFAIMLFVMWLAAINYGNSLIFAFTFLLASVALVSILHTFRNLRGLQVSALSPGPVFAGEAAIFILQLKHHSRTPRPAIGLELKRTLESLTDVPAQGHASLMLRQPTRQRGWLVPPRVRLFTIFPLGLFHAWASLEINQRCLVYPAPEIGAVPPPGGAGSSGGALQGGSGQEDFQELRRYRPGDSPRHVAWRVVARGQDPQTKVFGGESLSPVWLDWHSLTALGPDARRARLCRWVLDAEAAQQRYGLRLPGVEIKPGLGHEHNARCLQALALMP